MEENFNQNENEEKSPHSKLECDGGHCWLKYVVITLAAFFGAFLAVYFVADMTMHRYFMTTMPTIVHPDDVDELLQKQEEIFQDITKFQPAVNPFMVNPVKIQTYQEGDDYKIVVDLAPFNNNPDNIKLEVKSKKVKLSGESNSNSEDMEKDVSFIQNFSLPKKIDVKEVTKEVKDGKYIITLPIED